MRFEFCGGIACPQWFLAQISVLTKITALKTKLVMGHLIEHYLTPGQAQKVYKLLAGTGLDQFEVNAVITTLTFIIANAVRVHLCDTTLCKELVDLGLPRENAESISKAYKISRDKLIQAQSFITISHDLRLTASIHQFFASDRLPRTHHKFAQCLLSWNNVEGMPRQSQFNATKDVIDEIVFQLDSALEIMQKKDVKNNDM